MESRFSYTLVGLFVVVLAAVAIGIAFWLYAGGPEAYRQRLYYAYFDESVAGLNVNAPVRFKGVVVGRVVEVGLAPDGSGRVRLALSVEEKAPIRADTVATLRMQGLTGLVQVELSGGSPASPPLLPPPGEKVPIIPTRPSLVSRLDTAVTTVLANLNRSAENLNALTDEETRRTLRAILANVETSTRLLAQQLPLVDTTLRNTAQASHEVSRLAHRLQETAGTVDRLAEEIARAGRATTGAAGQVETQLAQVGAQTLPELNALLMDMRELAATLRRAGERLEREPGGLLWGRPGPPPGPGE
jgi:phospholipid/cholesterol/gamma-HCH transport system substrate-binding protein